MAARAGYTALTPETTITFPPRYTSAPAPIQNSPEAAWRNTADKLNFIPSITVRDALHRGLEQLHGFVDNNAGLLLVALAQLFFAFVNVSIKVLKEIDSRIATFQVRMG